MMNKTPPKELLPHRWFFVGIVGVFMDIAKVPDHYRAFFGGSRNYYFVPSGDK
ncbi:MAG: hypothetical protein Ct9H300mP4_13270 [Gammaproteobacteria bacterium]|nr:MAG: hypothetical protein Ct9H300mP4_13270 [Gammaproteobacteria bacterium]